MTKGRSKYLLRDLRACELFWWRKTSGALSWLRKNPERAILAAEKSRACYIGRGKSLGGLFLIHRKPSEEQFCEARIPQRLVLGPGNGKSPVRFPAPPRSVWGNLLIIVGYWFHQFGNALGCVWEWLVMG